jgi:hypothetical protein
MLSGMIDTRPYPEWVIDTRPYPEGDRAPGTRLIHFALHFTKAPLSAQVASAVGALWARHPFPHSRALASPSVVAIQQSWRWRAWAAWPSPGRRCLASSLPCSSAGAARLRLSSRAPLRPPWSACNAPATPKGLASALEASSFPCSLLLSLVSVCLRIGF